MMLVLGVVATSPAVRAQSNEVLDTLKAEDRPWAEGVPETTQAGAREVFAEANRMMKDGLFARAAAAYKETLALWEHAAAYYNLGLAQVSLDQPIEAYESFDKAMRFGPVPLQGQEKYEQAQRYREMLEKQLARIEIVCEEEGAAVTLNGRHVFTGPGRHEGMVRPGGHQIVASKVGRIPATEQAVLSPGEQRRYDLILAVPESVETERRWAAWKPWAVVGAGVVVMGGAAHFDNYSSENFDRFDSEFDTLCRNGCTEAEVPQALQDSLARADREQRLAQVSYAIGGAALITGVALVYLNRERLVRRGGSVDRGHTARVSPLPAFEPALRPVLGPGHAGFQVELPF
jgi:tetratricopeptide (TPR) repeat protein